MPSRGVNHVDQHYVPQIPLNKQWINMGGSASTPYPFFKFGDGPKQIMRAVQCIHRIGQRQCSRRSIYTIPMCWQHLISDYQITVGQTTLKDVHGVRLPTVGIFACNPKDEDGLVFHARQAIVPYIGNNMSVAEHDQKYPGDTSAPYSVAIANGRVIDSSLMRGVGSLAQDCRAANRNRGDCDQNNAVVVEGAAGNYPMLVAKRDIFDGEEIFMSYGSHYWSGDVRPMKTFGRFNKLKYKCGRA